MPSGEGARHSFVITLNSASEQAEQLILRGEILGWMTL